MEKLSLSVENQLILMEKYSLTAEEVLLIDLLFLASAEERHADCLLKYFSIPIERSELRKLLISLQSKGIISKQYNIPEKGKSFDPECVIFNKNFLNSYKKFSGELGYELLTTYPSNGIINGEPVPLNNWAKKFNNIEDFCYAYGKSIGWKSEQHKKVLELIEWAKSTSCNLLNMNIADFMMSQIWKNIEELKDGKSTITFNPIQSV